MACEEGDQYSRFFVAVHVGAGFHAPSNEKALRSAMKRACLAAASILRKGSGGSLDAVAAAIQVLEDDPCTNAGRGSNLTEDGNVECDASIMDGRSGAFGAVGAVPGVRNPIQIAVSLVKEQMMGLSLLGFWLVKDALHGQSPKVLLQMELYQRSMRSQSGPVPACTKVLHAFHRDDQCGGKKSAGVLLVQAEVSPPMVPDASMSLKAVEFVAAYTSSSFGVGYFGNSMERPKVSILRNTRLQQQTGVDHFAARLHLASDNL